MKPNSPSDSPALTDPSKPLPVQTSSRFRLDVRLQVFLLVGLTVALFLRLLRLIDLYSVNILFYDQWDFYGPLFHGDNWLTMFRLQNGPHRQGCGLFVTKLVAELTGWNTRAETFALAGIIGLACLLAFALKKRLFGRWDWSDAILPLLFLTPAQADAFFETPNPAYGALPLLLIMIYCLAWTARRYPTRYAILVFTNFLLIYTGFGVFMGLITPFLLAVECRRNRQEGDVPALRWAAAALALSLLSAASFLIGYKFRTANESFEALHPRLWDYPWFVTILLANFFVITRIKIATVVGAGLLALMIGVGILHARRWVRERSPISVVIVTLLAYSLLFALNNAYGRVSLGIAQAQSSRYATLLIPAFFGLYLHTLTLRSGRRRTLWQALALVLAAWGCLPLHPAETRTIEQFSQGKSRWKAAYLQTGSIAEADRLSGFKIYPHPERTHLQDKLDFLRRHHLNLFRTQD